ncbi:MAG: hypothetical protein LBN20_04085 [Endomicrobium sp.]|jgi:hypothetical protein|nr:hypothetical protein [Endomicrobium sp.]
MNMKTSKNFLWSIVFIASTIIIFIGLEKLFFMNVPLPNLTSGGVNPVWDKIQSKNGKQADILFFGTSRDYSSYDTYMLSKMFNKEIYSLAIPSSGIDAAYASLKIALKYCSPKIIILSASTFSRGLTHRVGGIWAGFDGISNYFYKLQALYLERSSKKNIPMGLFQLFRNPVNTWARWDKKRYALKFFDEYGNHHYFHNYRGEFKPTRISLMKRNDITTLRKIIDLASESGIEIWVYTPPSAKTEINEKNKLLKENPEIKYYDDLIDNYEEIGLNASEVASHMNYSGALKTTLYYAKLIQERTGWEIDNSVFMWAGNKMDEIDNGKWRYTALNTQSDALYYFELIDNKKVIKTQGFSKQNYFDCEVDILKKPQYSVNVIMLPAGTTNFDARTIKTAGISLSFMK